MADPLDQQLVEAVLTRPRRAKADLEEAKLATRGLRAAKVVLPKVEGDDDDEDDDLDLGGSDVLDGDVGVEVVGENGEAVDNKLPVDAPAKLDAKEVEEPTAEELEAPLGRHDRDRRPGPDVPQGDRQGRPPDRRGRGRPRQGDRARRAARRGAVEGHRLAPRVDAPRHRAQDPDGRSRSTACRSATRRTRWSATRSRTRAPRTCWSRTPDFHLIKAGKDAQSDGTKALLKEAKKLVAAYNEKLDSPDSFLPLLDWAYLAVHNGDLDSRDNVGPAGDLRLDARRGRVPGARALDHGRQRRRPAQADGLRPGGAAQHEAGPPQGRAGPDRARRPRAADVGQPAAGRVDRQEVHRARDVVPGPDPGRQHRPDPGGREVRLREGLQVLHLRHVVDPAGDHPRHRRPGPDDPHPGPHGRDDQPPDPRLAAAPPGARPRADGRGDRRGDVEGPGGPGHARRRSARSSRSRRSRSRSRRRSARRRTRTSATSSRTAGRWPRPRPRRTSSSRSRSRRCSTR